VLEADGQPSLKDFRKQIASEMIDISDNLLSDRRGSGNDLLTVKVLEEGPGDGIKVDSRMNEIMPVLGGKGGLEEERGYFRKADPPASPSFV
jgi:hypothetical protein